MRSDSPSVVIVNGIVYHVEHVTTDWRGELLAIRRPRGHKVYAARRLPDSPIYGQDRAYIVCVL